MQKLEDEENKKMRLDEKEKDAIGEIFNIAVGSSSTALSMVLGTSVTLSVPDVELINTKELDMTYLEPAYAISVDYVKGLSGTNSLLLKKEDLLKIVSKMMYMEVTEIDELSESAICELMNQMMGASSTALASMLRHEVDISIPKIGLIKDTNSYKDFMYGQNENVLTVTFTLEIKDFLTTNFITVMSHEIYDSILEQLPILHA